MSDLKIYMPGTHKLIQHLDHLKKIKAGDIVAPLHVSIWPTIRCQSKCAYCCCRNEDKGQPDLDFSDFSVALNALATWGTKAIEFAGGGEPLLWPSFEQAVINASDRGLKISLITNGLVLEDISQAILARLAWIRVSLQSAQHARTVAFSHIPKHVRVSASYIIGQHDTEKDFRALHDFAKKNNLVVRIAVAQPSTKMDEDAGRAVAVAYGAPFFFAEKETGTPSGCYMAWIRAAIDWRGWFLPCPSVMLADDSGKISDEFRLCHVQRLEKWLIENRPRDLGFRCAFCNCGKEHNELMHSFLGGVQDDEFV